MLHTSVIMLSLYCMGKSKILLQTDNRPWNARMLRYHRITNEKEVPNRFCISCTYMRKTMTVWKLRYQITNGLFHFLYNQGLADFFLFLSSRAPSFKHSRNQTNLSRLRYVFFLWVHSYSIVRSYSTVKN